MASREQTELENLALAGELARQLCHDFNNFVYNFSLQLEIARTTSTLSHTTDWDAIKVEADRMIHRLRQWDHFQRRFSFEETAVDLNQLIRQVANDVSSQRGSVALGPGVTGEPLVIGTAARDCGRLVRLVIEDSFDAFEAAETSANVSVDAKSTDGRVTLRIIAEGLTKGSLRSEESLLAATCRSLAVRLGAVVRNVSENDRQIVEVDLPKSMMSMSS